jgi:hypothetical protein
MGYSTRFTGELRFKEELTARQVAALTQMFAEDCRDHPEWEAPGLYYVDLEFNEDFTALRWNGAEKTYDLHLIVNVVIAQMRKRWPGFALDGTLIAQGEDIEDRWALVIGEDGLAQKQPIALTGTRVTCPHCNRQFVMQQPGATQ